MKAIVFAIVAGLYALVFGAWVYFFAPCSALGWMPVQSAPLRCIGAAR